MSEAKMFFIQESEDYDDIPYGIAFSGSEITPSSIREWNTSMEWGINTKPRFDEILPLLLSAARLLHCAVHKAPCFKVLVNV